MRGYDRPTFEDLDEYEEEEGEEEEGQEEEEYEEEEPPKPTKEELEYLELRQRLKEGFRKKIKKESSSAHNSYQDKRNKLPYDNFGSFFGPSQPVIAQRVIQESKSLLETRHFASKISNAHHSNKTTFPSPAARPKYEVQDQPRKVNELKMKVQKIRDMRDYSFLLSDDAELPGPTKESRPQNITGNSEVPASLKGKQSLSSSGRQFLNGREERKPVSMNLPKQPKPGINNFAAANKSNYTSAKRPNMVSDNSRKQLVHSSRSGPGWSAGPNSLPSKVTAAKMEKKLPAVGSKNGVLAMHKSSSSKMQTSIPKQHFQQKESQEPKLGKGALKQPVMSSKPSISKHSKSIPSHKKKPVRQYSDDVDDDEDSRALSMIRKMFGYNPNKFAGHDDDDSDMEANFADIQEEEKRSERIARKEDEEELRKIEEEERRETLRKLEKKRKLSQR